MTADPFRKNFDAANAGVFVSRIDISVIERRMCDGSHPMHSSHGSKSMCAWRHIWHEVWWIRQGKNNDYHQCYTCHKQIFAPSVDTDVVRLHARIFVPFYETPSFRYGLGWHTLHASQEIICCIGYFVDLQMLLKHATVYAVHDTIGRDEEKCAGLTRFSREVILVSIPSTNTSFHKSAVHKEPNACDSNAALSIEINVFLDVKRH
jgi:hypothetical protein